MVKEVFCVEMCGFGRMRDRLSSFVTARRIFFYVYESSDGRWYCDS